MKLFKLIHDLQRDAHYCKTFDELDDVLDKYKELVSWRNHKREKCER